MKNNSGECGRLLRRIQELEFIAVELNLYLDNHPNDTRALTEYNRVHDELRKQIEQYDRSCGPLLGFGQSRNHGNTWLWAEQPWPWEM
jgi:spore coat protein JB